MLFNIFNSIIENNEIDFFAKNIELKILNSIISGFVFSVHLDQLNKLYDFFDYHTSTSNYKFHQYFKLRNDAMDNLYSITGGLNEKYLKEKTGVTFELI
jgi:hypothetical protein